jgi:hypothetical protein
MKRSAMWIHVPGTKLSGMREAARTDFGGLLFGGTEPLEILAFPAWIFLIGLFFLSARFALAVTLTLAWDANPAEHNVLFYTLYIAEGETAGFVKLADVTSPIAEVSGVPASCVCRFRVTATNEFGESPPSAEVVFQGKNP